MKSVFVILSFGVYAVNTVLAGTCSSGAECVVGMDVCNDGSICTEAEIPVAASSVMQEIPAEATAQAPPPNEAPPIATETATITTEVAALPSTTPDTIPTSSLEASVSSTESGVLPKETISTGDKSAEQGFPPVQLTQEEAIDATAFELETAVESFLAASKLRKRALPASDVSEDTEPAPIVLPSCPDVTPNTKRGLFDNIFGKRPKKPTFACTPGSLTIQVHIHYVANGYFLTFPIVLGARINKQYGITLQYSGTPNLIINRRFTDNHELVDGDVLEETSSSGKFQHDFMRQSRVKGPDVLNIWIYSFYPGWKLFDFDGIVIRTSALSRIGSEFEPETKTAGFGDAQGGVMVQSFGHWMGLQKIFGVDNCGAGDGIADTNTYSNQYAASYSCNQILCGTKKSFFVRNWMSKRAEDKVNLTAEFLLNNCFQAIQDVFEEESIPLAKEVLQSYSTAASSMQANSTAKNDDSVNPRPATKTPVTATPNPTASSKANPTSASSPSPTKKKNDSTGSFGILSLWVYVTPGLMVLLGSVAFWL
ncbi:hypothetical protein IFR05_009737 [Cadophora sp. M221]|nr:hypothetical protein IFR05_009737 [Cadophora sp. M221]